MDTKLGLGLTAVALVICGMLTMNFGAESRPTEQQSAAIAEQKAEELTNLGIQQRLAHQGDQKAMAVNRRRQPTRESGVGLH